MDDRVALSVSQFCRAWHCFAAASPHATVETGPGVEYVFCGLPIPFFNVALVTEPGTGADALAARARSARDWASGAAQPWMLIVTHEWLAPAVDAAAVLDACGMAPVLPLTGMIAERLTPARSVPDGIGIGAPQDEAACAALIDINSRAYGMDLGACKPMYGTRTFWSNHFSALGRADGAGATCAAVLMVDGYRYVALVATDPAYQRRGFAEAAMRHALAAASEAHGEGPTFLHATEAGRPIYARMGYTPVANHTAFMEKRFLGAH